MNYLSYDQYSEYGGQLDEADFNKLIGPTSSVIDLATFNRLCLLDSLPDNIKAYVEKATYYQLEYINNTGGIESLLGNDSTDSIQSESIGNYSITNKSDVNNKISIAGITLCSLAANELDKANLRCCWIRRPWR